MRKLLLISYSFPPLLGPESTMTLNYVKYLPQLGWIPVVLCGKPSLLEPLDASSLDEVSPMVKVYRTNSLENLTLNLSRKTKALSFPHEMGRCAEPQSSSSENFLLKILRKMKPLPYRKVGWIMFAFVAAMDILKRENIEVIVSRSGPINSHMLALVLKNLTGLPWIACFSDPWTTDPNNLYRGLLLPGNLAKWYDELLERKIMFSADKVIFTTKILKDEYLRRFTTILKDKFLVIPNSCDLAMLPAYDKKINCEKGKFTMAYAGNFMNQRSPEPLFKALRLLEEETHIGAKINVQLIGRLGCFEHLISKYGLANVVQVVDPVPHRQVFNYLYDSDVLLLIDAPSHTMCLASKLVEYLFIGKPILAITSKEGAAAEVVRTTQTGIVVSPHDIVGIKNAIKSFYTDYVNAGLSTKPDWTKIDGYTAESCTRMLVRVIDSILAKKTTDVSTSKYRKHST